MSSKRAKKFKNRVNKDTQGEYKVIGEYVDIHTPITIKHMECGHEYDVIPLSFNNGYRRCPICTKKSRNQALTTSEYKKKLNKEGNGEYTLLTEYVNSTTSVKVRHKCGHEYYITPNTFTTGYHRCSKCSSKPISINDIEQKAIKLLDDEYDIIEITTDDITIRHNICNFKYKISNQYIINNNLNKIKCKKCYKEIREKSTEDFKQEIKELTDGEYEVVGEYIDRRTPIHIRHNTCGNEYKVRPSNFLDGNRCPTCAMESRLEAVRFDLTYIENYMDKYDYKLLSKDYVNSKEKLEIQHKVCGTTFSIRFNDFKNNKQRCPKCGNIDKIYKISKTHEEFIDEVYKHVGNEYEVIGKYERWDKDIEMKHIKCGNTFSIRPHNFITNKQRCSICSKSKYENEIRDFISDIYNGEIIYNDRDILDGLELDFYLPDKKIAIEFNGLYWHSDKFIDKDYHLNKTIACDSKGIKLIHIFEDEWLNKKEIVKNKIIYILGLNKNTRVYARSCYIERCSKSEKKNLLENNHIQGNDNSTIDLGLYRKNDDKLVAVMTFCPVRMGISKRKDSDTYTYELSRFATDNSYVVPGAFSKLLTYFIKKYKYNSIITYSDIRWSGLSNTVYDTGIFKYKGKSKPNYWYCKNGRRYHRASYMKHKLSEKFPNIYNENMTEFEIMNKTSFHRVYDCGNLIYEIEKLDVSE